MVGAAEAASQRRRCGDVVRTRAALAENLLVPTSKLRRSVVHLARRKPAVNELQVLDCNRDTLRV